MAGVWGILSAMTLAPPILAALGYSLAAGGIYFFFSCLCQQSPDRTFTIFDFPLAVCHRCCGIYWGFFLGSFLGNSWIHRSPGARRNWTIAAVSVLAFDALAPYFGLWTNTWHTRFLTGMTFGIVASSLLLQGIREFIAETPWRRLAPRESRLQGGIS